MLVSWSVQESLSDVPIVGAHDLLVANAVGVLPLSCAQGNKEAKGLVVGHVGLLVGGFDVFPEIVVEAMIDGTSVLPIRLDRSPEVVIDSFVVGIAVLDDERLHALGMRCREAEPQGSTVVH